MNKTKNKIAALACGLSLTSSCMAYNAHFVFHNWLGSQDGLSSSEPGQGVVYPGWWALPPNWLFYAPDTVQGTWQVAKMYYATVHLGYPITQSFPYIGWPGCTAQRRIEIGAPTVFNQGENGSIAFCNGWSGQTWLLGNHPTWQTPIIGYLYGYVVRFTLSKPWVGQTPAPMPINGTPIGSSFLETVSEATFWPNDKTVRNVFYINQGTLVFDVFVQPHLFEPDSFSLISEWGAGVPIPSLEQQYPFTGNWENFSTYWPSLD